MNARAEIRGRDRARGPSPDHRRAIEYGADIEFLDDEEFLDGFDARDQIRNLIDLSGHFDLDGDPGVRSHGLWV